MKFENFIGIDISKKTIDVVLYNQKDDKKSDYKQFSNEKEGFEQMIQWVKRKINSLKTTLFSLEHTGVYSYNIAIFFEEKGYTYTLLVPLQIKRSMGIVRGKSDKSDAYIIAKYSYLYREEIPINKIKSDIVFKLKSLLSERQSFIKNLVKEKQKLKEQKHFLSDSAIERSQKIQKQIVNFIKQIDLEIKDLIKIDTEIKKNFELITSVKGIGLINAIVFIINTNNFKQITDPRKYASYCGVAPFEYSSGTSIKGKTKVSPIANKFAKAMLTTAAMSAKENDGELKKYYNRKTKEGKAYGVVLNAIKFKLITRVYAVIRRQTPYVELPQVGQD
mgnify:CR=1 FL=1